MELITAPSFPQLLDQLEREMAISVEASPRGPKWVVVPNASLADHLRLHQGASPWREARVVPVTAFVSHLSGHMDPTPAPRWGPLFDMLLYQLVQGLAPDSPLAPIRTAAGGHHLLRPTFLDLADGGFGLEQDDLLEEMIQEGDLKPLERATLSLYRSWMQLLRIRDVAWQPFWNQRLPEWILSLQPDHLAGLLDGGPRNRPHLFLYGYYDLTDINTQLVVALATRMSVTSFLPLHREKNEAHRAFGFTQEIAQDLQARTGSLFRERRSGRLPSELTSFFLDTFPEGAIGPRPRRLTFQSASGPRAELISAAVRIRTWMEHSSAPIEAGQILLLAPQLERYSDLAPEVFDDFCIPLQNPDPAFSAEARILKNLARIWERQGDSEMGSFLPAGESAHPGAGGRGCRCLRKQDSRAGYLGRRRMGTGSGEYTAIGLPVQFQRTASHRRDPRLLGPIPQLGPNRPFRSAPSPARDRQVLAERAFHTGSSCGGSGDTFGPLR